MELYVSEVDGAAVAESQARRARLAAEELAREGTPIRCQRSIFVPEDEMCFLLYEAAQVEDVEQAARRASLRVERIAEAIAGGAGEEWL